MLSISTHILSNFTSSTYHIVYLHYFLPDTSAGRRGRPKPPFGYEWGGEGQTLRSDLSPFRSLPYFPARSQICSPFLRRSILPYSQLNPVETTTPPLKTRSASDLNHPPLCGRYIRFFRIIKFYYFKKIRMVPNMETIHIRR